MKAFFVSLILLSLISLDAIAQINGPNDVGYSKWTIYITRQLDLHTPANKVLDSVFNEYGKTMKLTQMLFDRVTAGRADAYIRTGKADSSSMLDYHSAKEITDSLYSTKFDKIFFLECWKFDTINNRMVVRILKLSPAVKLDENRYVPTIWIPYPKLRYYLSRHYILDTKGKRLDLNDYFEGRYFAGKIISSYKPSIR
ncbi:MAG: hypothetical protein K8F30_14920 [Taibaiella sp.]|nr:hypothetical protein [Taibaiella sp.]